MPYTQILNFVTCRMIFTRDGNVYLKLCIKLVASVIRWTSKPCKSNYKLTASTSAVRSPISIRSTRAADKYEINKCCKKSSFLSSSPQLSILFHRVGWRGIISFQWCWLLTHHDSWYRYRLSISCYFSIYIVPLVQEWGVLKSMTDMFLKMTSIETY